MLQNIVVSPLRAAVRTLKDHLVEDFFDGPVQVRDLFLRSALYALPLIASGGNLALHALEAISSVAREALLRLVNYVLTQLAQKVVYSCTQFCWLVLREGYLAFLVIAIHILMGLVLLQEFSLFIITYNNTNQIF